jgi:hypothetical protein
MGVSLVNRLGLHWGSHGDNGQSCSDDTIGQLVRLMTGRDSSRIRPVRNEQ